jgi:hypothetical protein
MEPREPTPYASDHLYLSAYLCCLGHRLIGTDRDPSGRTRFLFVNSADVRSAAAEYLAGWLMPGNSPSRC